MNQYIGHPFQLYGVEEYTLNGGRKEGNRILHVKNGLGLEMTISLSRGGDITSLTYKGINTSYLTPNGHVNPAYYDDNFDGWIKTFQAGFLTTCGFNNVGTPCEDKNGKYPLHGSINQLPVENYSYDIVGDDIDVRLVTLDEAIFSRKLKRIRHIVVSMKDNSFEIIDEIENRGGESSDVSVLYHFNIGYPLLKEDLLIKLNQDGIEARNDHANDFIDEWSKMEKPTSSFEEMCYFFHMKNNIGEAKIYSPSEKIGLAINYDANSLPFFTEWKMNGVRDYVLGLEPGNVTPEGYVINKEKGRVLTLGPDEKVKYTVKIRLFDDKNEFEK